MKVSIITVADDTSLTISASVRESDLAALRTGNEVTFTSPSNPGKKYTGRLENISPVAAADPAETAAPNSKGKATFPVTISVTGNREGLRIGSTTKLSIIAAKQANSLTVPLSAIGTEESGQKFVMLLDGDTLRKKPVTVTTSSDFDAAITGNIKSDDQVVTQVEKYKNHDGVHALITK